MAGEIQYSPGEAAYALTRTEMFDARAAFYRFVNMPRDDKLMPIDVPAGDVVARRVTAITDARSWVRAPEYQLGDPASDVLLRYADLVITTDPPGRTVQDPAPVLNPGILRVGEVRRYGPLPPPRFFPDATRAVAMLAAPALASIPPPVVLRKGEVGPVVALYPRPVDQNLVGMLAVTCAAADHGKFLVRRDGGPIVADTSWRSTAWGDELAHVFVPPVVMGGYGVTAPASVLQFDQEDAVLVADPHPYIPASALSRVTLEPPTATLDNVFFQVAPRTMTLRRVRSLGIAYLSGDQNGPRRLEPGWLGSHEKREVQDVARQISREISRIDDNVARIAGAVVASVQAVARNVASGDLSLDQIGAAVLVTALTGPAGLVLLGSDHPWRDAIRVGALHYALAYSPLVKLGERVTAQGLAVERAGGGSVARPAAGAPLRVGVADLSEPHFDVGGVLVSASDIEAAEVVAQQMLLLDRAGAQALLEKIVLGAGQYGGLYVDLVLARLVVEAEGDAKRRQALLAQFVGLQAQWWDSYGQYIARAVGTALDVVAPGLGSLLWSIAKMLYEAALMVQKLEVQAAAQRAADRRAREELAALEALIAALEAEMARGAGALVPVAAPAPTAAPAPGTLARPERWYAPALRWAAREWLPPPAG